MADKFWLIRNLAANCGKVMTGFEIAESTAAGRE
jgi:hypothetical protein